ncbi:MAG: hypothetical protein DIJKHBIC_02651 [Thermoanaerobaculia bacterium]|nr:hypothetical protein [Thermoanaerobaculia bacterium]
MSTDSLDALAGLISKGLAANDNGLKKLIEEAVRGRYRLNDKAFQARDAYGLARGDSEDKVPWAGVINPENPVSGPYGGTSLVWFPTKENGSLLSLVVGTRGLAPDEGILTRPGHRRRVAALRRLLSGKGIEVWTKPDPASLGVEVPDSVLRKFDEFSPSLRRYGRELYCLARVPEDVQKAREVLQAFLDLYAVERGWQPLASFRRDFEAFASELRADLFPRVSSSDVSELLRERRFVILQGPPGTGKTRLADEVKATAFSGNGMTVQFHPAITYEDFVVGLAPDAAHEQLRFGVRRGWLLEAAEAAERNPFLLVIDEVNRADLGKVLGEAIYLFEPREVGGPAARSVRLPHAVNGRASFSLPVGLFVLATMNTADRSIATIDLAIRRRFAFVTIPPDRTVIDRQGLGLATDLFDRISDVFVEHAPDEALDLLPGHAYFLAPGESELKKRLRYELLPLLDEYLRQGVLGPAGAELHAVRDSVADVSAAD